MIKISFALAMKAQPMKTLKVMLSMRCTLAYHNLTGFHLWIKHIINGVDLRILMHSKKWTQLWWFPYFDQISGEGGNIFKILDFGFNMTWSYQLLSSYEPPEVLSKQKNYCRNQHLLLFSSFHIFFPPLDDKVLIKADKLIE